MRKEKKRQESKKAVNRSDALWKDRQTGKEIKTLSQKHALKATACKSLPFGDNITITNPYMNALPFINMKTTTTTTIKRTIMKSNPIMVHVALI